MSWAEIIAVTVSHRRHVPPFDVIPYPDTSGLVAELEGKGPEALDEVCDKLDDLEDLAVFGVTPTPGMAA